MTRPILFILGTVLLLLLYQSGARPLVVMSFTIALVALVLMNEQTIHQQVSDILTPTGGRNAQ
jgi:hypothetical protein